MNIDEAASKFKIPMRNMNMATSIVHITNTLIKNRTGEIGRVSESVVLNFKDGHTETYGEHYD